MQYVTDFIQRRARLVVAFGVLLAIIAASHGSGVFAHLTSSGGLEDKNSESYQVSELVAEEFGQPSGDAVVLFSSTNGRTVHDDAFRQEVEAGLTALRNQGAQTTSYYDTRHADMVSHDEKQTYAVASFLNMEDDEKFELLKRFEEEYTTSTVVVTVGGQVVAEHEVTEQVENDLIRAEIISLPIIAILLLLIFRSAVAAALPLLLGVFAIVGGLSIVRLMTNFTDVDQYAVNVITVLGLGLAIDYSLLMVSRFREELERQSSVIEAVRHTTLNAGRTIFFSGLVVMVSLLGLAIFPISFLHSVGVGGASVVVVAMFGALIILPALLLLVGRHINRWHISKRAVRDHMQSQHERWRAIGAVVMRRPFISSVLVLVLVAVLAFPALDVKFKAADVDYRELPTNTSSYAVGEAMERNFASQDSYLQVVYERPGGVQNSAGIGDLYDLTERIEQLDDVVRVESLTATDSMSREIYQQLYEQDIVPPEFRQAEEQLATGEVTRLNVYYQEDTTEEATADLVAELRSLEVPSGTVLVGGEAAVQYDVFEVVREYSVYALVLVLSAMFVLLMFLLRSIIVPIQAILINSLSLLAVLGVLVWIFQMGNLTDGTWLTATNGLDVTVPVLIFAIAFGLAMDYTVFLYGRMREEYDKEPENTRAVLRGLELTGPIITQAAILLAVVVLAFGASNIAMLQQIGLGLAFVVLFDTFIIRIFLVPAIMRISGRANWWAPKWLKSVKIKH